MAKTEVSVIIPTYNRGSKIYETLESVWANNLGKEKYEIIIVDDYSEPRKSEEARKIVKHFKNVRYYRNDKNRGPAFSRNRGAKYAKGKFIFFTDDDCIVPKEWIQKYLKFFRDNPKVVCVGSYCEPGSKNLFGMYEWLKIRILGINVKSKQIGHSEIQTGFTGNTAYKKAIFLKNGGFNVKLRRGEDVELKRRLGERYLIASVYCPVIHNQEYTLDYFLSSLIKEGLDVQPKKTRKEKIWMLICGFPKIITNFAKKIGKYRNNGSKS